MNNQECYGNSHYDKLFQRYLRVQVVRLSAGLTTGWMNKFRSNAQESYLMHVHHPPIKRSAKASHRLSRHIGVIPDGNRRWARAHQLTQQAGYAVGLSRPCGF
jgi:hypothetical protein